MQKLKIVHLLSSTTFSGAENVVITIINAIGKNHSDQFEFYYLSPDGPIRNYLGAQKITFVPIQKYNLYNIYQKINELNPDIIHAHDFKASVFSAVIKKKRHIISHLHNNPAWIKHWCPNTVFYGLVMGRFSKILCVSNAIVKEFIFRNDYLHQKSLVVGNPIMLKNIVHNLPKVSVTKKYDIAFLGRLTEQKNPERFIQLISQYIEGHSSIQAVMIGDGDKRCGCRNLIEKFRLADQIKMEGYVNPPFVLLKQCKILCIPSRWEGFGLAAVEALALGLPVVAANVGGLPGIVNESCGMICTTDQEYLDELHRLLCDAEYYTNKSLGAVRRAEELENIKEYTESMIDIYQSSMGES